MHEVMNDSKLEVACEWGSGVAGIDGACFCVQKYYKLFSTLPEKLITG